MVNASANRRQEGAATCKSRRTISDKFGRRGVADFADLILLAAAELRREPLPGYSAVIVDEAQDLSAAMVHMLYSVVGDRPDGFTLIGDGQQSI